MSKTISRLISVPIIAFLLFASLYTNAQAGTKAWGLRGAGFEGWSQGVDQIAEQARHIPGVTRTAVFNYYQTTEVYNEIVAAKAAEPRVRIAIFGYSCGANAAVLIANSIRGNVNEVLGMQPSIWCGGGIVNTLNRNIGYGQNTYSWLTFGLGSQQWQGARRLSQIERTARHLQADTDPAYQADVLGAIEFLATQEPPQCNPARHHCHGHTLVVHRTPSGERRGVLIHHGQ
jgi:hypothetical protein